MIAPRPVPAAASAAAAAAAAAATPAVATPVPAAFPPTPQNWYMLEIFSSRTRGGNQSRSEEPASGSSHALLVDLARQGGKRIRRKVSEATSLASHPARLRPGARGKRLAVRRSGAAENGGRIQPLPLAREKHRRDRLGRYRKPRGVWVLHAQWSCSEAEVPPVTVAGVDRSRYKGSWYQTVDKINSGTCRIEGIHGVGQATRRGKGYWV